MSDNQKRAKALREKHIQWRNERFLLKDGFFPVFKDFEYYLPKISGGAVSLFIYLGIHSNNKTGECYHDLERIAKFFDKTPRTITNWFAELEDIGLIERFQLKLNGVAHTFIVPYSKNNIQ
ncbi:MULTISPECIES: helix-turn-helix domain-containing protein [Brevibacillus]|uniref:helix-turn-helix domain-containing protein n=1 Tax=Brevibacillus TaxID=55080 RepID=UPI002040D598|nr:MULTISPECIES: helix-turn-helix domain-containing protein [Brevibacillus]MCM3625263.1 helix-turn-helix domain-containing protein [Brevibacillus borstelensis]MDH4620043.1 helix-turn-helix domain-containing protein [Brevibacillus sp. AY1]